jgi:ABC-type multidrug transport system fused ATPase/permease subunit
MHTSAAFRRTDGRFRVLHDLADLLRPCRRAFVLGFAFVAINRLAGLVRPAASKFVLDDVIQKGRIDLLWPIIAAIAAAIVLQAWTAYLLKVVTSSFSNRFVTDLRTRVQDHIGRLPVTYFDANKTGALVSRVMSDAEGIQYLFGRGLIQSVGDIVIAVGGMAVLFWLNAPMTLLSITLLSGLVIIVRRLVQTIHPIALERQRIQALVRGRLTESFSGIRVIKGFHAEAREAQTFRDGAAQILDNAESGTKAAARMNMVATFLLGLVSASVLIIGSRLMLAGQMTVGEFVSYSSILGAVLFPIYQTVDIGSDLSSAMASLDRIREVLIETPEDVDVRRITHVSDMVGHVVFDDVSFEYELGRPVLRHINLEAKPGTVTALVGSSGAGKSTLIGLVAAFHRPRAGTISVDGIDLSTVRLDSYRSQLGAVLQDTFVFDGPIREAIRFGRPEATDLEVEHAARLAGVEEFAVRFADGYDTMIGERGVKMSGGQRQRIAIARAMLANPRILILDEATSSLDQETEARIQDALAALMRGRTTFVIAHRLTTIRRADQILVLEAGTIVERGTHAELIARGGRYYELYTWQDARGRWLHQPEPDHAVVVLP